MPQAHSLTLEGVPHLVLTEMEVQRRSGLRGVHELKHRQRAVGIPRLRLDRGAGECSELATVRLRALEPTQSLSSLRIGPSCSNLSAVRQ